MSFRQWLRHVSAILLPSKCSPKKNRRPKYRGRPTRPLELETLEERLAPATGVWIGGGANTNWTTAGNWQGGVIPNASGDIAQFQGTYTANQTVTVNAPITVAEIDFGSNKNITISSNGGTGNVLTLDNTANATNAILDVGHNFPNTAVDTLNVPLLENSQVLAIISGGTLNVTNTAAALPNQANGFVSTDTFTVNSSGTLEAAADPSSPALGNAAINLGGGTLQIDSGATASALNNLVTDLAGASSTIATTGASAVTLSNTTAFAGNGTLTITSAGASSLSMNTLSLPLTGPATDTLVQNAANALTVNSVTDDSLGDETLTYAGTGTVILPNFSGDTNTSVLNGATLNLGSSNSLGSGGVTLTSGTIEVSSASLTINNNLTFSSGGSVTAAGVNAFTLGGSITLTGTDTLNQTDSGGLTLAGGTVGTGTLNVVIGTNDALTIAGTNPFTIGSVTTNGADTLTQNDSALLTVSGGTTGTGTLNLVYGANTAVAFTGTAPSTISAVTLSSSDTLTVSGTGGTTITGASPAPATIR